MTRIARLVGLVANPNLEEAVSTTARFSRELAAAAEVVLSQEVAQKLGQPGVPVERMEADMVICFGGDGTMLRTLQKLPRPTPILGVNFGDVGFLPQLEPRQAEQELLRLIGGFEVREAMRLAVELNGQKMPPALNEAVLVTSRPAKIAHFRVEVDGRLLDEYRADGVVLATPTGSTAYSMSAGGPIVDPRVDATLIVPLAPYRLSARPWVVPGSSEILVRTLREYKHCNLVIDGQHYEEVGSHDQMRFTRSEQPALFVDAGPKFYKKVREKLE